MKLIMELNQLLFYNYKLLFLAILLLPHPSHTTLFDEIFWASTSKFHTGTHIPIELVYESVAKN